MEHRTLSVHLLLQEWFGGLEVVEGPVDGGVAARLVLLAVQTLEVFVFERVIDRDAFVGVEGEHLGDEVECVGVGLGEDLGQPLALAAGDLGQKPPRRPALRQPLQILLLGRPQDVDDLLDLVQVVAAREQRTPTQQLAEDAPNRPHVHRPPVVARVQHHLRRAIPPGHHVVGQRRICAGAVRLGQPPGQSEVANLEIAVFVDEDV
mmetsp:Transcript_24456/g.60401  ORF Transcript_24456/g.60401 Transcript_24456/m.60401 type:complete len:206 (-) Transcript_24456:599-1216(-)